MEQGLSQECFQFWLPQLRSDFVKLKKFKEKVMKLMINLEN